MAGKAKIKTVVAHLFSSAQTGFFYTTKRAKTTKKLMAVKYDPLVRRRVLFVEKKTKK